MELPIHDWAFTTTNYYISEQQVEELCAMSSLGMKHSHDISTMRTRESTALRRINLGYTQDILGEYQQQQEEWRSAQSLVLIPNWNLGKKRRNIIGRLMSLNITMNSGWRNKLTILIPHSNFSSKTVTTVGGIQTIPEDSRRSRCWHCMVSTIVCPSPSNRYSISILKGHSESVVLRFFRTMKHCFKPFPAMPDMRKDIHRIFHLWISYYRLYPHAHPSICMGRTMPKSYLCSHSRVTLVFSAYWNGGSFLQYQERYPMVIHQWIPKITLVPKKQADQSGYQ